MVRGAGCGGGATKGPYLCFLMVVAVSSVSERERETDKLGQVDIKVDDNIHADIHYLKCQNITIETRGEGRQIRF